MDGLRWLLLFFGILVIAGVYFYSRREKQVAGTESTTSDKREPTLDNAREPSTAVDDRGNNDDLQSTVEIPQKIVTFRLIGRDKQPFAGDELILALRGIGLRHGRFGIFHRYDGNDDSQTIFSIASLVEPGSFDLANIKDQTIPGVSLFLVIPGPVDGVEAFDLMISTARALAQSLNGELLDESGSTLSIQRERYLREEVIQFQHSILVA